jgi:PKD repeat protein
LSAAGQPAGTSVRFSPASVAAGASSTMTVDVGSAALPGNYPLTIIATGPSTTHTLTITLTIEPSSVDFSITASPPSLTVAHGATGTSTVETTTTSGSPQTVGLSASGQPTGTAVSFNPTPVTTGGSSTMTVNVGAATAPGTYTITVTGTGTSVAHTTTVALTVTANQPPLAALTLSCSGLTCSFDASGSRDPDGSITSYAWDFGDGSNASGQSPTTTHTYQQPGAYSIRLTVTDNDGATATTSRTVTPIVLAGRGYRVNGLERVDLSWSGPSGAGFDIYRNTTRIATVQANAYTDKLNKQGSGTYTYKVCAAAFSSCSDPVTVTFSAAASTDRAGGSTRNGPVRHRRHHRQQTGIPQRGKKRS